MRDRKKTAILYGWVSSTAQAERGLSLPAQFRELRAWAEREGYRILKEVADTGGKDSKRDVLDRPGIKEVQDLVERGGVCVVVAQARDRFDEYPIPNMLAYELARLSKDQTTLRALDSSGEGEDAELGDLFRGWMAKRERRTTARRSRSRKLEIARQGYVIPAHTPTYGYEYTGEKKCRTYRVHEEHMGVMKLIFRMLAVEKMGVHGVLAGSIKRALHLRPRRTRRSIPRRAAVGRGSSSAMRCSPTCTNLTHLRRLRRSSTKASWPLA
jgi:DNA invertase Pin-like site-specific DNA recombinase